MFKLSLYEKKHQYKRKWFKGGNVQNIPNTQASAQKGNVGVDLLTADPVWSLKHFEEMRLWNDGSEDF